MTAVAILGCGYVGRAAIGALRAAGHRVTATTTTPAKLADLEALGADRAVVAVGDDPDSIRAALAGCDAVVVAVAARSKDGYERAYLQTANTLAAVMPTLPEVGQLVYTGSYAVYGDRGGAWVDETTPPRPSNANGEILVATEDTLRSLATDGRRVCILRLGGICGPGREIAKIFGAYAGTTRPGSGEDWSNWIHLDDIVGALTFAIAQGLDGIYNLVHDRPETQKTLIERAFRDRGLSPVRWNPDEPGPLRPYNARVSNRKLSAAGYDFRYSTIPT